MKIISYQCDRCKQIFQNKIVTFRKEAGKSMDASGNGYNTHYKYFEICEPCVVPFVLENKDCECYEG